MVPADVPPIVVEPRGFEPLSKQGIKKPSTCLAFNWAGYPAIQQT